MVLEQRLYAVVREAVGYEFETYGDLAQRVYEREPPEFTYNRLEEKHVMQQRSIVPYVSLAHFIGLLRVNTNDMYEYIHHREPTEAGLQEIITRKSVDILQDAGFTIEAYKGALKRLLQSRHFVLPAPREVYQALSLGITELQFIQLTSLSGVRKHFAFTIVTRRVMVPT